MCEYMSALAGKCMDSEYVCVCVHVYVQGHVCIAYVRGCPCESVYMFMLICV